MNVLSVIKKENLSQKKEEKKVYKLTQTKFERWSTKE